MPLHSLRSDQARLTVELAPVPTISDLPPRPPPREFRIFSKGAFRSLNTVGGRADFIFDEQSATLVMAKAQRKGTDYVIDYEHQTMNVPGRAPAAGYFKLSLRNGELWATEVEWTEQGAADLTSGKDKFGKRTPPAYRYHSPVFSFDDKTGRVTGLINLGLTNMPATRDMQALAASHRPASLTSSSSASRSNSNTNSQASIASGGDRKEKKMSKSSAKSEAMEILKSAHADAIASLKDTNTSLVSTNEELRAALSEAKTLATAHEVELSTLKAQAKDVAAIAGKETLAEAKGAFAALKQESTKNAETVAELKAKFDKLDADAKIAKLTQLVDKGVTDGKITPAEREHFLKAELSFVETILAIRPAVVKMNAGTEPPKPADTLPMPDLAPDLLATLSALGHDPAKLAASMRQGGAVQTVVS